jgi:hypothetical protein
VHNVEYSLQNHVSVRSMIYIGLQFCKLIRWPDRNFRSPCPNNDPVFLNTLNAPVQYQLDTSTKSKCATRCFTTEANTECGLDIY